MARRHATAAAATAAVLALSGCAAPPAAPVPTPTWVDLSTFDPEHDGNGLTLLSPQDARAQVLAAMAETDGTMELTFRDASDRSLRVTVSGSPQRYSAEVTADGATTSIVVVGAEAAVRPSAPVAAEAGLAAGAVACVAATDELVTRWRPLLDPAALVADMTTDASGLGAPVDGTVQLLLGAEGATGVLDVAASGTALPSRLTRTDEAGSLDARFSGWGVPADVALPADC